jgi:two-component system OmpR family sensor kinase
MERRDRAMKRSLQVYLCCWLAVIVAIVAVLAGGYSFFAAIHEANEYQDAQLRQIAALVDQNALVPVSPAMRPNEGHEARKRAVVIQVLDRAQPRAAAWPGGALDLPENLPDGFLTLTVNDVPWRFYVVALRSGDRLAVGQRTAARDELARGSGWRTLVPFIILIPVLIATIILMVRRGLLPVSRLARGIDARIHHDLRPLDDTQVPREIRPFVVSINGLLGRVRESMAMQRRFVADAAHELRSPLTAMSVQLDNVSAAQLPADAAARLEQLRGGLRRTIALAEQLLSLARSQDATVQPIQSIDAKPVISRVVEDLLPLALARSTDLGVEIEDGVRIASTPVDLATVVRNVLDNAIRYTPEGGRVDLRLRGGAAAASLEVEDNGPGIPVEDRNRVFDRFYRIVGSRQSGSGLGLSIVATIVNRWQGRIALSDAHAGSPAGLRVRIEIPNSPTERTH